MKKVIADTINGVMEVSGFDAGEPNVDEVMFYKCLIDLGPHKPLSAEISDEMYDRIKDEYGITTL